MRVSRIASLKSGVGFPLSGVAAIAPAADMTFSLWRKSQGDGQAVVMPGDAFQVNGTPLVSTSSERSLYDATQMLGSWGATGAVVRANVSLIDRGKGYAVGNTFHLINRGPGPVYETTPHDEVVTVTEVWPDGGIKQFTMGGQGSAYQVGTAIAAADVLTTAQRVATFQINQVGSFIAATVTAIDVNIDDTADHETYKLFVARGTLSDLVNPGPWAEYEVEGRTGAISDGHISTVTGTYTAGQVLKILEGGVDGGGRFTVATIDGAADIATGYISARGTGYTVADNKVLTTIADGAVSARFDVTRLDDFTLSTGTVTFIIPTVTGTISQAPVGMKSLPRAGDWLKVVAYLSGQLVFPFSATEVGATPTVNALSTSTGAKIVQVANPVAGALKTVTLGSAAGSGYEVGDILEIVQEGASGGKVVVLTLATTAVATVAVIEGGSGYTADTNLATVNEMAGSDDACTITVSAVATAGEYVTRTVTVTYALSGTGNLIVTFVDGAKPPAGELVRMSHTFALGNKVALDVLADPAAHVPEVYKVEVSGVAKTLDTDYTLRGGLKLGTGVLSCTTVTATAAADDVVELTQAGASGGQIKILTVDGSADVATFEVIAAGTGYFAATGLGCTKVSGTGATHSAIRFTIAVADVDPSFVFFMANKSPAAEAAVHALVASNAMVCVQGDAVEFDDTRGGYTYNRLVPTADVVAAVAYGV